MAPPSEADPTPGSSVARRYRKSGPPDTVRESSAEREGSPNNLPLALTSFVGRDREVGAIEELLGRNRLLTLTGPGGSGKTRLASAVASGAAEGFEDGAWWVELAPLSDPTLVSQAVASSLDVRGAPGRALSEVLVEHLEDKNILLVLDNCEHLIDACAALADSLLRSCPDLRVLATSREALSVAGEAVWPVPPLSAPDPGRTPSLEELGRYEAVRLFVDRTRSVAPAFELTGRNAAAVARLCRRLEGMPLAVELAAARARVLAVEQIATHLNDSLRLLKTESRTVDPRQRTLKATIEWSFELLTEEEQTLFRQLSVFSGGWTLAAAEEVWAGEVLDILSRLVDKSLVSVVEQQGEEARYRLPETIRQYGAQVLEDSLEGPEVRRRHAEFFLALAEGLEPAMWGAEEAAWLARLEAEDDNLRAALSWAIEHDAELGLRLAGALRWYWYWRGYYGEGRGWLDKALSKSGPGAAARAKALHAVGWLAHDQGDMDRVEAAAEEGIALSRKAEVGGSLAASFWNQLGEVARHRGDYERATALFEEGTALYREAGDRRGVAWGLFLQGNALSLRGDHGRATALYEEGLVLCRELGGAQPLGDYLAHLGYEFLLRGDRKRAAALNEQAAALLRRQGYKGGLQFALNNLGWVALVRGLLERARALYGESLLLCRELGDRLTASESIEGLACAAGIRGETERAARLFGVAEALREAVGYRQAPKGHALREPHLTAIRAQVDKEAWEAAWEEGRAMTPEQAVEYALSELSAPSVKPVPTAQAAPEREVENHPSPKELRIFALGRARVELGERTLAPSDWTYAKSRELLFYLLSHPPRTREQAGLDLWPDASPSQLRKAFHNAVYYVRQALGDQGWIVFEGGRYSFDRSLGRYYFDVEAFEMNLAEARRLKTETPGEAVRRLEEAVSLYEGDFLEGSPGAEWVLARQDELRRAYEEALLGLGSLFFEGERYAEAAEAYRKAIAFDRYSEIAHRRLMQCYAGLGEPGRALLHYRDLSRMLGEELGSSPAPESAELYERLRRGGNP